MNIWRLFSKIGEFLTIESIIYSWTFYEEINCVGSFTDCCVQNLLSTRESVNNINKKLMSEILTEIYSWFYGVNRNSLFFLSISSLSHSDICIFFSMIHWSNFVFIIWSNLLHWRRRLFLVITPTFSCVFFFRPSRERRSYFFSVDVQSGWHWYIDVLLCLI